MLTLIYDVVSTILPHHTFMTGWTLCFYRNLMDTSPIPYAMDKLLKLLDRAGTMPEDLKTELGKIMVQRTYRRREFLIKPGKVNEFLFFFCKGTARCFTVRSAGGKAEQEINRRFLLENDFFGSLDRFHRGLIEDQYVEALKPCIVLMTSIRSYESAMEKYPEFYKLNYETWCRTEVSSDRVADMLRLPTAAERFEFLTSNFPDLRKNIRLKYLASFMGLDTTTLYKVKNSNSANGFHL